MSNVTTAEISSRIQEAMLKQASMGMMPNKILKSYDPEPYSGFTIRRAANGVVFTYNGTDYVATNEIAATAIILNLIKQQLDPNYE